MFDIKLMILSYAAMTQSSEQTIVSLNDDHITKTVFSTYMRCVYKYMEVIKSALVSISSLLSTTWEKWSKFLFIANELIESQSGKATSNCLFWMPFDSAAKSFIFMPIDRLFFCKRSSILHDQFELYYTNARQCAYQIHLQYALVLSILFRCESIESAFIKLLLYQEHVKCLKKRN